MMENHDRTRKLNVIREHLGLPRADDYFIIDICLDEKISRIKDGKEKS
jgi:hypothetical protein